MRYKLFFTLLILFAIFAEPAFAIENPLQAPNNKFGIHIQSTSDLHDAANLVNSTNGDWGYVTVVIREDERKVEDWQKEFDNMRRLHLIPIVRIASKSTGNHWEKLDTNHISDWATFLDSLNWVVKNRYIIVGNEPNHAKEWGGQVSPEEYSDYLLQFSKTLKEKSPDFFILPAGLDASAPNDISHMDEVKFLKNMIQKNSDIFDKVDGWTSHSYPNPGFSGLETDEGRGSIRTFEWEIDFLKKLGITKDLPIFITETGWVHPSMDKKNENASKNTKAIETIAKRLVYAFQNVWNQDKIVAVTPFILNYQENPFSQFSWRKYDGSFYEFYSTIQNIEKIAGKPTQENKGELRTVLLANAIQKNGEMYGIAYVKNTGQKVWKKGDNEPIPIGDDAFITTENSLTDIYPGEEGAVLYQENYQAMQPELKSAKIISYLYAGR